MSTLDEIQMSARIRIEEPDEIETSGPAAELDMSALYMAGAKEPHGADEHHTRAWPLGAGPGGQCARQAHHLRR